MAAQREGVVPLVLGLLLDGASDVGRLQRTESEVERGFAEWNRGRSEGVFLPSGNWNTDELPVPRRIAALKAGWLYPHARWRKAALRGAPYDFHLALVYFGDFLT